MAHFKRAGINHSPTAPYSENFSVLYMFGFSAGLPSSLVRGPLAFYRIGLVCLSVPSGCYYVGLPSRSVRLVKGPSWMLVKTSGVLSFALPLVHLPALSMGRTIIA